MSITLMTAMEFDCLLLFELRALDGIYIVVSFVEDNDD